MRILPLAFLLLASCGSRSTLPGFSSNETAGTGADAGTAGSGGSPATTTNSTNSSGGTGGAPDCDLNDVLSWKAEHFRDFGDYPRAVAATSEVPWIALKIRDGNIVLREVAISADKGIEILNSFEIPDSQVYPVAFDVSDKRFVLLTTSGHNWNGDLELWSIDRQTNEVVHIPMGNPPADPGYTVVTAIALLEDNIALAYTRLIDGQATFELRDSALQVSLSQNLKVISLQGVRGPSSLDVYSGANLMVRIEPQGIVSQDLPPGWTTMGGLNNTLVQYDLQIRMKQGDTEWLGRWPHTQISPPAVVRTHNGMPVFSLETELTGVVGYPVGGELRWLEVEPSDEASGIGLALMPLVEKKRLGFFYLALDIPQPEQPLRYFGRFCQ
ncbi:MAG: hypothetical protein IPK82_34245 [Polyangiaceae bacterium]|nr:hypothetical protein [Polyangiaceae bacterium]